jgi:colanic acid biosynthesis glycosyl transferase WcaI
MEHGREWVKLGHQVAVVTCVPNFPQGGIFAGYRNLLYQEEWLEGIRVIGVGSCMAPNKATVKRILDYASYMLSATAMCWRYPGFNVILATSPPLFVALGGVLESLIRQRTWVFEIRNLRLASIEPVGALDDQVIRYLEKLEFFLYRKADRIISLTHSFKKNLD